MADQNIWTKVDDYFGSALAGNDPALAATLAANAKAGLPAIDVSPLQGKFLALMVQIAGAKRILEIGTLGGYSTICMVRAAGPAGAVITLEADARHAEVARKNIAAAGLAGQVEIKLGPAIQTLPSLAGPFDLVFIDADKRSNPDYLASALRLSRPGTIILIDNVVREGRVLDASGRDKDIEGIRRCTEMLAKEPRLTATAIQTVGAKGYDGFVLAVVEA